MQGPIHFFPAAHFSWIALNAMPDRGHHKELLRALTVSEEHIQQHHGQTLRLFVLAVLQGLTQLLLAPVMRVFVSTVMPQLGPQ